ncbi:MAG: hypothetical protein ACEQSA_05390 [Weeksellaceae bacterium]
MKARKHLGNRTQLIIYASVIVFIVGYLLFKGIQSFRASYFVSAPERLNIVQYGSRTAFYSLTSTSGRSYVMYLPPDLKMSVPGGYGEYRLGSVGKLVHLYKDPSLIQKTLSVASSSFVHAYFYTSSDEVFYGTEVAAEKTRPSIRTIMFADSNIGYLDRLYLALKLIRQSGEDYTLLSYNEEVNKIYNEILFEDEAFEQNTIGLLYQKPYRLEQQNIQLQYADSYKTAVKLSALLEGNGIRVNDLAEKRQPVQRCQLIHDQQHDSQTLRDMAVFFDCDVKEGDTDIYDILFVLGEAEQAWEIR